jgi:D-inositol-3-phosphate glycosyltransferase
LVAIEALAAGRRLLCHNIDGLSDHARHGGVMIDTANIEELRDLIAREASADCKVKKGSVVRTTRQLENQFCDCWQFLLREVGV